MRREELEVQKVPTVLITKLKDLITLRDKGVRERSGYKARVKELNATRQYGKSHIQNKIPLRRIKQLTADIKEVESAIGSILEKNEALQMNYQLLTSIKGVGFITAVYMIAYTENFQKFANSRQFSCYEGVVPFEHISGTSIRGKSRVSHYANKKAKRLLNLAASVAIQHNRELKQYYLSKKSWGRKKQNEYTKHYQE